MRVQHGDMDGKWLTVWLRISLTRLRPGQVGRPPPGGSARRPGEDLDEEVRALAVEAAAAQVAVAQTAAAQTAAAQAAAAQPRR